MTAFPPRTVLASVFSLVATLTLSSAANAIIIAPVSATSTSWSGEWSRTIDKAIDGSGLNRNGLSGNVLNETHADGFTKGTYWESASTAMGGNTTSPTEVLTFDLGGTYNIDTIYYWRFNHASNEAGIKTFSIAISTDGGSNFMPPVSAASLGMADWIQGTHGGASSAESRPISLPTGATHIRLTGLTTFGSTSSVVLNEIRFGGEPTPVPGDLDGDGDVDGIDISEAFANYTGPDNGPPTNPLADLDGDGDVDGVDMSTIFTTYTGPLAPAVIPEPTSLALIGLGGVFFARRRR